MYAIYTYTHTCIYVHIYAYTYIYVTITKKPQWKFPNLLKLFNSILLHIFRLLWIELKVLGTVKQHVPLYFGIWYWLYIKYIKNRLGLWKIELFDSSIILLKFNMKKCSGSPVMKHHKKIDP